VVPRGDPPVSIALPRPGEFWQGFLKNESLGLILARELCASDPEVFPPKQFNR
jgi:hypothetical protein